MGSDDATGPAGVKASVSRFDRNETVEVGSKSSPSSASLERGATVGRYVITREVGRGGMGEVYLAYDPELDRRLALKIIRKRELERLEEDDVGEVVLLREAQAMARLSHPNVVNVYDAGRRDDDVFIAMEYIEGVTLKSWLEQRERGWREILDVFLEAGRGLDAAHRAGIVHRDFKPGNVMVEATADGTSRGRARVLDFGLAQKADPRDLEGDSTASTSMASGALTTSSEMSFDRARVVFGTPAFMAPEHFEGRPVDARSDQFSFCVALFMALYQRRPYPGKTLGQLRRSVLAGRVATPKTMRGPRRILRLLEQGLTPEPDGRHANMASLLSALERARGQPVRRMLIGGAIVGAAALVGLGYAGAATQAADTGPPICGSAQPRLDGVWDETRRNRLRAAFEAVDKPYAADTLPAVEHTLDAYAEQWAETYTDACEATRIRGDQSEELLDLRMRCLDRRLDALQAATDLLLQADAQLVARSFRLAQSLPDLWECSDAESLTSPVAPPDEAAREAVEQLRTRLAETHVLVESARYDGAIEKLEPLVAEADALGYKPVLAEAYLQLAKAKASSGDATAAETAYLEAVYNATASHHDYAAAQAWAGLVHAAAMLAERERAEGYVRHAQAMLERFPDNPNVGRRVPLNIGVLRFMHGEYAEAAKHYEAAYEVSRRHAGPQSDLAFGALNNLAAARGAMGEHEESLESFRTAHAIAKKTRGEYHPETATCLNNVGIALANLGRTDEALEKYQRALQLRIASLGPQHPDVAQSYNNIAALLHDTGRSDEALETFYKALSIREKTLGEDHPRTAMTLSNIGDVLNSTGRSKEAIPLVQRAIRVLEDKVGPENAYVAMASLNLGRAHLASGDPRRAIELLERGLQLGDEPGFDTMAIARAQVDLSRALRAVDGPESRVGELLDAAAEHLMALGDEGAPLLAEIDALRRAARPPRRR